MEQNPMVLVNFFAPWCTHCKKLKPVLDEVADDLVEAGIQAKIGSFDVSRVGGEDYVTREGISGFPTLLVFKEGVRIAEYHGGRSHKDLTDYLRMKSGPSLRPLESIFDLMTKLNQFEMGELQDRGFFSIVVGAFITFDSAVSPTHGDQQLDVQVDGDTASDTIKSWKRGIQGHGAEIFNNTARSFELALFYITEEPEILTYFNVQEDSVLVFQEFPDDIKHVLPLDGSLSELEIMQYLLLESLPVTIPYSAETRGAIRQLPVKSHVLMFTNTHSTTDPFIEALERISLQFKGRLVFIEVDPSEHQLASYFGFRSTMLPQLVIANMTDAEAMSRYSFADYLYEKLPTQKASTMYRNAIGEGPHSIFKIEDENEHHLKYTEEQLVAFFQAYLAGQLHPSLTSESLGEIKKLNAHLPKDKRTGRYFVENIAGKQFAERVLLQFKRSSFVYIHAPWCGHCKSIEPVMSDVGRYYLEQQEQSKPTTAPTGTSTDNIHTVLAGDVDVLRMDGTKNEILHPGVRVLGFPTMYFFPAGRKEHPIEYDGERTTTAILHFIQSFHPTTGTGTSSPPSPSSSPASATSSSSSGDSDTASTAGGVVAAMEEEHQHQHSSNPSPSPETS
eukprot:CAMPEP_0174973238 /NCGR_PEP_ID=MMETSP0004_2-20121128/11115_1 /TAXON_ID=420556 /ORGANISM="Ochromonas sp., Strain CCMP1393" /LENGTH=616 /DNA_ID=CAMNT_0016223633 /DNA_START=73 /DNA_END=1923 /DNA_ORIENTATION=-